MDHYSEKTKSLLIDIDEKAIQEQDEVLQEDNAKEIEEIVEKPAVRSTSEHNSVFTEKKPKRSKGNKVKFEVKEEQGQPNEDIQNEVVSKDTNEVSTEKPALPITYREKKRLEKEAKKAEERKLKEIERAKRREETAERNRKKARERYWKEKEKKQNEQQQVNKEIPQKIISDTKSKLNNFQKAEVKQKINNTMDFYQFASYMAQYEDLKHNYIQQKEIEKQQQKVKEDMERKQQQHREQMEREKYIPFSRQFQRKKNMPDMFI